MFEQLRFEALSERVDRAALRAYRLRTEGAKQRRLWPRILGFLGSCALVVVLALYVTEGELALVPWFVVGIAALWVAGWLVARRAAGRRSRERVRLERFAQRNGITVEFGVSDEALEVTSPELLFSPHPKAVTEIRMRGRDRDGAEFELGLRTAPEPLPSGGEKAVAVLYLVVECPRGVGTEHAPVAVAEVITALPEVVVAGTVPTSFYLQELGDRRVAYTMEALDLTDPASWRRLGAVGDRLAAAAF